MHSLRWRPAWAATMAGVALCAGATGAAVEVLDVTPLHTAPALAGPKPAELSGLAWDAQRGELVAVSDKGRVFHIALDIEHRRLHAASVRAAARIEGPGHPNAESVAVDRDTLWIADERRRDLLQVSRDGRALQRQPLPPPLAERSAQRGNSGVEALVLHPTHGKLLIAQRPPRDAGDGTHRIHAEDGRVFAFRADARAKSSVKAADLLDNGRLLVLEKIATDPQPRFQLRLVALASCPETQPCNPVVWPIALPREAETLNLEGLACLSHDLCVLVNDNANARGTPSHLVLVGLPPL